MRYAGIRSSVDEVEAAMWREIEAACDAAREPVRFLRPLTCVECEATSVDGAGWVGLYLSLGFVETVVYCPRCALREFTG